MENFSKDKCLYCGKNNKIFKLGYCKSCYDLILKSKVILNPSVEFKNDLVKNITNFYLKNPTISKKKIAKKYRVPLSKVYYTLKKYTICIKVES